MSNLWLVKRFEDKLSQMELALRAGLQIDVITD